MEFNILINKIVESVATGLFAIVVFVVVSNIIPIKQRLAFFGIFNKWIVLCVLLYTFGFIKHEVGYYLTIESNYCEQTNICKKLLEQPDQSFVDRFKNTASFLGNIWAESIGEGILFVLVGLPLFVLFDNKMMAAFSTGILANSIAEYSGIHKYFCRKSCNMYHLDGLWV
jgi:hypothetical protein